MQVLMSDSLLNRVSTEEPIREKLMATFVFLEGGNQFPLTAIKFSGKTVISIGIGFNSLEQITLLLSSEAPVDMSIKELDLYLQNILSGKHNLIEHNNYVYELVVHLENKDG